MRRMRDDITHRVNSMSPRQRLAVSVVLALAYQIAAILAAPLF